MRSPFPSHSIERMLLRIGDRVLQNLCNKNVAHSVDFLRWSCIAVVQAYCSGYYLEKEGSWVPSLQGSVAKMLQNPAVQSPALIGQSPHTACGGMRVLLPVCSRNHFHMVLS